MSWYRTGTVSVTSGSANVTLAGGNALANIFTDDGFIGPDGRTYAVNTIGGAGSFTLQSNYLGATAAGQPYQIIPVADYVQLRSALEQVNTLITAYQDIAIKAGVGLFEAGNAAAPGVRGIGHTGTGLVWNGDESLSVSAAGTIMATVFANLFRLNNIPLNIATPKADFTIVADGVNNAGGTLLSYSWASGGQGPLRFANAGGEVMRLAGSGAVGIGTTAPAVALHVKSSGEIARLETSAARGGGNGFFSISDPTGRKSFLGYGGLDDNFYLMNEMNAGIYFGTNGTINMRMDPAGNVGINAVPTVRLEVAGVAVGGGAIQTVAKLRSLSDASSNSVELLLEPIISGGTKTGIRATREGASTNCALQLVANNAVRMSVDSSGNILPGADNAQTMGWPSVRWSVVYAATGTINTSDERDKDWLGEASPNAVAAALQIIDELGFYTWKDGGKREHFGPRAQRVWNICAEHGLCDPITGSGKDQRPGKTPLAFLCFDEWGEETRPVVVERTVKAKFKGRGAKRIEVEPERIEYHDTGKTEITLKAGNRFGIRPDMLNAFMIAGLNAHRKAQDNIIESLDERLSKLEGKVKP